MIVFATDTETTGLINFNKDSMEEGQPNATEVAAVLYDTNEKRIVAQFCAMVVPHGFTIDDGSVAAQITGITHKRASEFGFPGSVIAQTLARMIEMADEFMAYNESYDRWIITKLLEQHGLSVSMNGIPTTCVMKLAKDYCKMAPTEKMVAAGFNTNKNPKLTEAYTICTGKELTGAHSALTDLLGMMEVYEHIKTADETKAA